jgi:hypothetical protein
VDKDEDTEVNIAFANEVIVGALSGIEGTVLLTSLQVKKE